MSMHKAEKQYIIRTYECDKNSNLRFVTLMNIFQDIADTHASEIGLGLEFCKTHGLAWVGASYDIRISQYPTLHQKINVSSWPAVEKKLGAYREFLVTDGNGKEMIRASSQWILINFEKKRPVCLRENLPEYQVINERMIETDFPRIPSPIRIDSSAEFGVRFDDIDLNNHVNNAIYPLWAFEGMSKAFRQDYIPVKVEIAFKKEAFLEDVICVETQINDEISIHNIKSLDDNRVLAEVKATWKKL